jgi:hypothetical protein
MIEGLACAWPTGSAASRESPADVGVIAWTDRAGQQAAPAWSERGLQNATTRRAVLHQFRRPLADLRWTFQVSRGMVSMTARSKRPHYLRSPADTTGAAKASWKVMSRPTVPCPGGAAAGRRGVRGAAPRVQEVPSSPTNPLSAEHGRVELFRVSGGQMACGFKGIARPAPGY